MCMYVAEHSDDTSFSVLCQDGTSLDRQLHLVLYMCTYLCVACAKMAHLLCQDDTSLDRRLHFVLYACVLVCMCVCMFVCG